jgi:ABC-type nitrate/sulfonate/bicarbonate transport system permease component
MITIYRLVAFAVFLLLWWAASFASQFIPTPLETAIAAKAMFADETIYRSIGQTLSVYATGYLLGVLVALPVGLLMGGFRVLGRTLEVYVNALMATPRVAFIPLIIVLFGLGFQAKIAVIFLGTVMPILINTYAGVLNADGELVEMARSVGASRAQVFRRILLPGALPFVVVGLRLGATIGLINTVVAELYTAVRGLGGLLALYGNTFQMERYFVVVFVLATVGTLVTQGLRLVESRMERWRYESR